eukprot:GEMP01009025.1.p1 GENE.GEMP01009025.1~~GEMP01009025.1.p1  ORF type:complete len:782 (+),score=162.44 GEMP01009025.1:161-2506(+)
MRDSSNSSRESCKPNLVSWDESPRFLAAMRAGKPQVVQAARDARAPYAAAAGTDDEQRGPHFVSSNVASHETLLQQIELSDDPRPHHKASNGASRAFLLREAEVLNDPQGGIDDHYGGDPAAPAAAPQRPTSSNSDSSTSSDQHGAGHRHLLSDRDLAGTLSRASFHKTEGAGDKGVNLFTSSLPPLHSRAGTAPPVHQRRWAKVDFDRDFDSISSSPASEDDREKAISVWSSTDSIRRASLDPNEQGDRIVLSGKDSRIIRRPSWSSLDSSAKRRMTFHLDGDGQAGFSTGTSANRSVAAGVTPTHQRTHALRETEHAGTRDQIFQRSESAEKRLRQSAVIGVMLDDHPSTTKVSSLRTSIMQRRMEEEEEQQRVIRNARDARRQHQHEDQLNQKHGQQRQQKERQKEQQQQLQLQLQQQLQQQEEEHQQEQQREQRQAVKKTSAFASAPAGRMNGNRAPSVETRSHKLIRESTMRTTVPFSGVPQIGMPAVSSTSREQQLRESSRNNTVRTSANVSTNAHTPKRSTDEKKTDFHLLPMDVMRRSVLATIDLSEQAVLNSFGARSTTFVIAASKLPPVNIVFFEPEGKASDDIVNDGMVIAIYGGPVTRATVIEWSRIPALSHLFARNMTLAVAIFPLDTPCSAQDVETTIEWILDTNNSPQCILLGKESEGNTCIQYAVDNPACVAGLILVAPSGPVRACAAHLQCPVLALWAQDDYVMPSGDDMLQDDFIHILTTRAATLVVLADAGRTRNLADMMDKDPYCADAVRDFLAVNSGRIS